jgi:hypothetical protein
MKKGKKVALSSHTERYCLQVRQKTPQAVVWAFEGSGALFVEETVHQHGAKIPCCK